jgi:cell division protein FtsX
VSPAAAYARFREEYAGNSSLLSTATPTALPASFDVVLTSPDAFDAFKAAVADIDGVDLASQVGANLPGLGGS